MNYIIWNNLDSRTIKGLIICELPPITKPKMRTSETEIDGVDGSIIEELGYEAYSKTISIGLSWDYDIDEVMKYFTGSGTIVFSNEPDKYYNATIVDDIDYERLLRFKTAKVKLKVQPYKYLYKEVTQKYNNPTSGIIVLNRGLEASLPTMNIYGSGEIELSINGTGVFSYNFPTGDTYVTINSTKQDAYVESALKNRYMDGEFPTLQPERNTITWTGTITKIEVDANSRWL